MKRNREVTIVVDSLIESELINENERARASGVVKEALKKIRAEKYKERQKSTLPQGQSCVTASAKEKRKSEYTILELQQNDKGAHEILLDGKRLRRVFEYKIESSNVLAGVMLSLKMLVDFPERKGV